MYSSLWAGVDVGTQSIRVSVIDENDTLASAAVPLRSFRSENRHEQDPQDWWDGLCTALQKVAQNLPNDRRLADVVRVAFDTTSGTILLADESGRPQSHALMYDDQRASMLAQEVQVAGESVWNRLGYQMQSSWALPKLLWLKRSGAILPGTRMQHSADFLATRLTGTHVPSDWSHALKTGFDLDTLSWPAQVLESLGISPELLPQVKRPGSLLGYVSRSAADATGLKPGVEVRGGMTDGCAAQIAAGALEAGSWNSVLGTTLVLKGVTQTRLDDPTGAVYSHRHPDEGWLPGGASSTGTGALIDEFGSRHYDRDAAASKWQPSSGIAWPLRGTGERFPFYCPQARKFQRGTFANEEDRYSAWLQGLAFIERLAFEQLEYLGAPVYGTLTFTGGATRSMHLSQLRADVLKRAVRVLPDAEPSIGAALLAFAGDGSLTKAVAARPQRGQIVEPRTRISNRLEESYQEFIAELHLRGWLPKRGRSEETMNG